MEDFQIMCALKREEHPEAGQARRLLERHQAPDLLPVQHQVLVPRRVVKQVLPGRQAALTGGSKAAHCIIAWHR